MDAEDEATDPLSPDGEPEVEWEDYFPKGIDRCDLCGGAWPHTHTQGEYGMYELRME